MKMIAGLLLAAALWASVLAQGKPSQKKSGERGEAVNVPPKPAPEMEKLSKMFVGLWKTREKHEPGEITPKGGVGQGVETVRPGPGEMSLVYDYQASDPMGKFAAHGVLWWDVKERGYRNVECQNRSTTGCEVGLWRWEGRDLVSHNEGMKMAWTDITPTSRTFYMDTADGGQMKRVMTIEYTKSVKTAKP